MLDLQIGHGSHERFDSGNRNVRAFEGQLPQRRQTHQRIQAPIRDATVGQINRLQRRLPNLFTWQLSELLSLSQSLDDDLNQQRMQRQRAAEDEPHVGEFERQVGADAFEVFDDVRPG
jgi:hypothetical protein